MSNKKKLLPRNWKSIGCIIVDDLDDNNTDVSPEIVAKRLKWIESSHMPNRPVPSYVGDKVIVFADIAGGVDHKVEGMVVLIDGEIHILEVKQLNSI